MAIWVILFSLIIFDLFYALKFLSPSWNDEKLIYNCFFLFFINYIPLELFEAYKNEIYIFEENTFVININPKDYLLISWNWFLSFLKYSSIIYWYGFWVTGFMALVVVYKHSEIKPAYRSSLFAVINSIFYLLYFMLAILRSNEYLTLYVISIGISILTLIKLIHYNLNKQYLFILMIVATILTLKRTFYNNFDIFDISWSLLIFCFSALLVYTLSFYFLMSYACAFAFLAWTWAEVQEKRKTLIHIEQSLLKISKIKALIVFFTYAMYLTYNLVTNLWGELWVLKEIMFIIAADGIAGGLIYPEDGNSSRTSQDFLNFCSVYCQVLTFRAIFRVII
ncbi:unnamed protein product [Blepharisma stoltei]|uniref:Uncharacterized protein n=1 Tax=Blepharisma stoltei TaxID=1481888 RepID=A0AAU9JKU8_9CILI|nr:unnamed protein product [Blepharisma stoltei]